MASQRFLLLWAACAITAFSSAKAQVDLPTVIEADCKKIQFERCLKIEFKSDGDVVEYAGLNSQNNFAKILAGQLFNSDLYEIPGSYVTVSIGKDGTTAQVSFDLILRVADMALSWYEALSLQVLIRGSEKIGRLLELTVDLKSGFSEVNTVTKDPRFHFESTEEMPESYDQDMLDMLEYAKQTNKYEYDMDREAIPSSFKYDDNRYWAFF